MSTRASEARKILFNLTQKYCVGNKKRRQKTVSSSSDESSEDSYSPTVPRKYKESNQVKPFSNSASAKSSASENYSSTGDKAVSNVDRFVENSVSEIGSVISRKSTFDEKLLLIEPNFLPESVISSVDTGSNADNNSVAEVFSDVASDSSAGNVFANVHLLSDDVLEEIESNVRSDHSILEDRPSTVHSFKNIQLGSPLNPPDLELYDYESDFEDSDIESVKSELQEIIQPNNKKISKEPNSIPVLTLNEYILDKTIEQPADRELDPESLRPEITIESKEDESDVDENNSSIILRNETSEESLSSNTITKVSDYENGYNLSSTNNESKKDVPTNPEHVKIEGLESKSSIINPENSGRCLKKDVSINVTLCDPHSSKIGFKTTYVQTNDLIKSNCIHECVCKSCTNFNANKSTSNAGIQTDDIYIPDRLTEKRFSCRKPQKIYIDTSVKSTEFRPFISACSNTFCSKCVSNEKGSEYSPYKFTSQVSDGALVEEVFNAMLRNQIALTRHLIECHHRMYIQCCETVQNMNEQYKKSKLCFVLT